MTVTVHSLGGAQTFDQPEVDFTVNEDGTLEIDSDGNTVAIFSAWDSVSTDAFDLANPVNAPVAQAAEPAPANPAPPEPTPHAPEEAPAPVTTPETPAVPADTTVVPLTDTEGTEITPETPLPSAADPTSAGSTQTTS